MTLGLLLACAVSDPSRDTAAVQTETVQSAPESLSLAQEYTVPGAVQFLMADESGNDLFALTKNATDRRFELRGILAENSTSLIAQLPNSEARYYNSPKVVDIDGSQYIVSVYSSSTANTGNYAEHGLVVVDSDGAIVADHDIGGFGLAGASSIAVNAQTGEGYVVTNAFGDASDPYDSVAYGQSAIVKINDLLVDTTPDNYEVFPLAQEYVNASSILWNEQDQNLIVAAAGSLMDAQNAQSYILEIDPSNGDVLSETKTVAGVGINGTAKIRNGKVTFSGANQNDKSIVVYDIDTKEARPVNLPSVATQSFVADSVSLGDAAEGQFFSTTQGQETTFIYDNGTTATVLGTLPALYGVPAIEVGGLYCSGGPGPNESTIQCFGE